MDKFKIGENAGIIWRMMDNNKHWEYGELKKATGLSDRELNAAIGWLARENKIQFGTDESGQKRIFLSRHQSVYRIIGLKRLHSQAYIRPIVERTLSRTFSLSGFILPKTKRIFP